MQNAALATAPDNNNLGAPVAENCETLPDDSLALTSADYLAIEQLLLDFLLKHAVAAWRADAGANSPCRLWFGDCIAVVRHRP